ncbi:YgaP family membrane protein [Salinimicrobium soli]|uniref:YgaP family membrane protein n=1 Tax=Salinimicrobium soli TaxID=1254399 RepID=UPI003AAF01F8
MKKNMGTVDTILRAFIALMIVFLFLAKVITGTLAIVLLILAGIFLLTSMVNFCPLYTLFGFNTRKSKVRKGRR